MNEDNDVAVLEPMVRPEKKAKSATNPKILPPYVVIVYNDNDHTFQYVIITFQKVFGYSLERAAALAETIHREGRAVVWQGSKEVAELKVELIKSAGPDPYANKRVDWPLHAEIEPMT